MFKSKLKASAIHLVISLLLVLALISSLFALFFPKYLIGITDFKEVASIIITVDLILGPLLTFVVFNSQKSTKELIQDFSIIAIIQVSALLYGTFALYQIHPVYITFNVDRFTIVTARDAEPQKAIVDEYKVSKLSSGRLAFAKMPKDIEKRNDLLFSALNGGEDLDKREEYYQPFKDNISSIIAKSIDPIRIFNNSKAKEKAKYFLQNYQDRLNDLAFLPLSNNNKYSIIVLDKTTAKPITTINVDPWKLSVSNKKQTN